MGVCADKTIKGVEVLPVLGVSAACWSPTDLSLVSDSNEQKFGFIMWTHCTKSFCIETWPVYCLVE